MPQGDANKNFRMGPWLVQPDRNRLSDGERVVTLEPRLMDVLTCLAGRPGEIVSADKLLDRVWHGRALVDNTIYQAVAHLRKVLGDDVHHPRYIETIAKKGYRLICPVTSLAADSETPEITLHSPNGRRRRRRNIAVFAGIASIAVAIILTVNPQLREQLLQTNEGPRERSVAVLPFVDMSEDGNQQYLSDGVSEELIHVLSNLPDLRVTARTSSFAFRNSNEDIRQIGSKLNVATILEGSVRKDGDRIRVTSQLVDTRNGYHLWSQTFDQDTSDLLRIQSEIASAVARTFEYRELDALATDDLAARPDELQAYDFYLLGLHQLHKDTPSSYMLAVQHFERAIGIDPSFARAYAGLSEGYAGRFRYEGDEDLLEKAASAAEYALLLDDQSAEAYFALGRTKIKKRDHSGAETALIRAIDLNPNYAPALSWLATAYDRQGKEDEAFAILQKALDLNPMSGELNTYMGHLQYLATGGDWDTAFKYWKRAMERDPDYRHSYKFVGLYYWWIGQLDQAIPYIRKAVDLSTGPTKASPYIGLLASIYVDIGDYESAAQLIRRTKELEPNHLGATNSEIHLQLARGDYSAARDIVHRMVPANIDDYSIMGLMAFYELVIGDIDHTEEIYARLEAAPEPSGLNAEANLYRGNELSWGMLGAVNLAYLHKSNRDIGAARELLVKAREYIESKSDYPWSDHPWYVGGRWGGGSLYVLAQIAAVEGNNDAAIEYFRKAVDAGWTKAWFGRIDPITADLRKDARYIQILGELEEKLLEMREHPQVLASN
jgi:TolB-like protein/DNA-binding winged helix-turn-helix (wHTH) protein/Tfp pilus assembly protein PilF